MMKKVASAIFCMAILWVTPGFAKPKPVTDAYQLRVTMRDFTSCVVQRDPEAAASVLAMDFTTEEYGRALRSLTDERNDRCLTKANSSNRQLRTGNLAFAGGLAEAMLKRHNEPLLGRLSMAALNPVVKTYSKTDAMAVCMVSGAPDMVATLLDTEINSEAEAEAVGELVPVAEICLQNKGKLDASPLGMRSMLAAASFRPLAAYEGESDA